MTSRRNAFVKIMANGRKMGYWYALVFYYYDFLGSVVGRGSHFKATAALDLPGPKLVDCLSIAVKNVLSVSPQSGEWQSCNAVPRKGR